MTHPKPPTPYIYEDSLPEDITQKAYDEWFAQSTIVDGVRMGPPLKPTAPQSETPRVDRMLYATVPDIVTGETVDVVHVEDARNLERELSQALAERDEARAILQTIKDKALHQLGVDLELIK